MAAASVAVCLCSVESAPGTTLPSGFQESIVFSGLTNPTVVRFASDGRVFVAEKSGLIKVFDDLSDPTPTLFADLSTNVYNFWDRGLLGMALHPNFPATPYVYALYAYDAAIGGVAPRWGTPGVLSDPCPSPPGPTTNGCVVSGRLSRLEASGNVMTGPEHVLIEEWCQQYPSHSVGSLAFGPDGALYVSGGDGASFTFVDSGQNGNPCSDPASQGGALRSQDLRASGDPVTLDGTLLRVDPITGAALPDNPLSFEQDPNARRIIATGLRNPFRITFRPGTNELWAGDVGWNDSEELNLAADVRDATVENFGWPCYEGAGRQGGYDGANISICENLYGQTDVETAPYNRTAPHYAYNHAAKVVDGETCPTGSSSVAGLAFYNGTRFPARYNGALFFADYSRDCIWVMFPGTNGRPNPATVATFAAGAANPVELVVSPGGDLFYPDFDGGTIRRIATNDTTPPSVSITQPAGGATLSGTVSVAATASDNVAVAGVQFKLDGANLGAEDTSSPYTISWNTSTAANGAHTLTAVARDSAGNTTTSSNVNITVSNVAPPPGAGLVAAYGLNEGSGTAVADASGSGNNGTMTGAAWQLGRYGQALRFDSSGDWVTVADAASLDLTSGMTLEAWVNPSGFGTWRTIVLKQTSNYFTYSLYGNPSGLVYSQLVLAGTKFSASGGQALPLNTWTHVAATYDGSTLRVYRNGSQVASLAQAGAIDTSSGPLRIGGNSIWLNEFFNGLVDEVRVYNRPLSAAEIKTDMDTPIGGIPSDTTPPGAPTGLVAVAVGSTVNLSWSAASDNVGVTRYNVHRSTTSGFVPSLSNRIAQPTGTSYADSGRPPGTDYYLVTAEDAAGNVGPPSNQASATILNNAPTASIAAPSAATTWKVGDLISFSGSASDPEQGALPASALSWTLILQHCPSNCHTHTVQTWSGVASGSFNAPDHDYPSHLELRLTATDSGGQSHTESVELQPQTVQLSFATQPSGLQLVVGSASEATPFTRTVIVGSLNSISAPTPQSQAGKQYTFLIWSNGGAQTHNTVAPASPATYTATYAEAPVVPGLVAAYSFDEASGATIFDSSANGNHGTISGATRNASGQYGAALDFDGTNDLVTVPDSSSLDLTSGMTVEAWVRPLTTSGWRTVVLKERPGDTVYALYSSNNDNGRPNSRIRVNGSNASVNGTSRLTTSVWTHLAATFDGSNLRLYVNGSLVGTRTAAGTILTSANPLRIGGSSALGRWFRGRIDEVRVYNRALNVTEIQSDRTTPLSQTAAARRLADAAPQDGAPLGRSCGTLVFRCL